MSEVTPTQKSYLNMTLWRVGVDVAGEHSGDYMRASKDIPLVLHGQPVGNALRTGTTGPFYLPRRPTYQLTQTNEERALRLLPAELCVFDGTRFYPSQDYHGFYRFDALFTRWLTLSQELRKNRALSYRERNLRADVMEMAAAELRAALDWQPTVSVVPPIQFAQAAAATEADHVVPE